MALSGDRGVRSLSLAIVLLLIAGFASVAARSSSSNVPAGFVVRDGAGLELDGKPYRFSGVDAYQLATDYLLNRGCGTAPDSPADLLDVLPARGGVARIWAFQRFALSNKGPRFDWTALDRVVSTADRTGTKLAMVLSDQAGTCDNDHWHDSVWYTGGYTQKFGTGQHADLVSYDTWVRDVVTRYANSSAIAYWEPVNEPEASECAVGFSVSGCYGHGSCPADAAADLRQFFDAVGGTIHRLDRWHPVATGLIGGSQCGDAGTGFSTIGASPDVDLLTVHDYDPAVHTAMDARIRDAAALGKPLVFEEVGEQAGAGQSGCVGLDQRAADLAAKRATDLATPGVVGFLVWNWWTGPVSACDLAIAPDDPFMVLLSHLDEASPDLSP